MFNIMIEESYHREYAINNNDNEYSRSHDDDEAGIDIYVNNLAIFLQLAFPIDHDHDQRFLIATTYCYYLNMGFEDSEADDWLKRLMSASTTTTRSKNDNNEERGLLMPQKVLLLLLLIKPCLLLPTTVDNTVNMILRII